MAGISVFFPAYNDGATIASLVITAAKACASVTNDYEVIVIENGSTDNTVEILTALEPQVEHLRVLTHREPLGYGGALRRGSPPRRRNWSSTPTATARTTPRNCPCLSRR